MTNDNQSSSAIDFAGALSNAYNWGRSGTLTTSGGKLKGKLLSMYPQFRVTLDGRPGCVILTPKQFQERWKFEVESDRDGL